MNRTQFVLVLIAVAVLAALGWGVARWQGAHYEALDARVGQKLLPGFKVDEVAQIAITDGKETLTLLRGEKGWTVKERGGYPADLAPIRTLLLRLEELKVVQAEGVTDAVRPRMQLALPAAGAKPEETGTLVELKGRDGQPLGQVLLGRRITKQSPMPGLGEGIAAGRYVWLPSDPQRVNVVAEPFAGVQTEPARWLERDLVRVERLKSLVITGPDGTERWSIARPDEAGAWTWSGPAKLDFGKAQDAASALSAIAIADVAVGAGDADAGLDQAIVARAETFDGLRYELRIGRAAPGEQRYLKARLEGPLPSARSAPPEEKPEEKEKRDAEFAERTARLQREQALAPFVVRVAARAVEPLLREREALVAAPPKKAAPGGK